VKDETGDEGNRTANIVAIMMIAFYMDSALAARERLMKKG
jgi:hypothetical protein